MQLRWCSCGLRVGAVWRRPEPLQPAVSGAGQPLPSPHRRLPGGGLPHPTPPELDPCTQYHLPRQRQTSHGLLTASAPAAGTFAEGVTGWVGLFGMPVTEKCACIFSHWRPHIWHAANWASEIHAKSPDKLRNSALSSLPAVLSLHTVDISSERAAGPLSLWHCQGAVPHLSICQSGCARQGPSQRDRGSAVPSIAPPLGMVSGRSPQGLGETTKAAVWGAVAYRVICQSGGLPGQGSEPASLTATASPPGQGWLPPRIKLKYKSTQYVQWGIWAHIQVQNWANMTAWVVGLLDPVSRWPESLWPVSLSVNWLRCTLSKAVQFLAGHGLSQLLLNPWPSARIIIISGWFLTKGRI